MGLGQEKKKGIRITEPRPRSMIPTDPTTSSTGLGRNDDTTAQRKIASRVELVKGKKAGAS